MDKTNKPLRYGEDWTREESILAFDLYCRIPFKKTKANNKDVIALAALLQRSPGSVARKLGNFGAFDPELAKQNISGLTHTSELDEKIWNEFNSDWEKRVFDAENLRGKLTDKLPLSTRRISEKVFGSTEREVKTKQRIYQDFFRDAVLASYNQSCCICGLPHPEILIASHILPWSVGKDFRVNPENGLCLCASHDKAFDRQLLVIGTDYTVILASRVKSSKSVASKNLFTAFEGKRISLPDRFVPRQDFLSWRLEEFKKCERAA